VNTIHLELPSVERKSTVFSGGLSELEGYCRPKKVVIITDERVRELYGPLFPSSTVTIEMGRGEEYKTLQTVESIFKEFLESRVDRSWLVLGVGGGIVCDVTGFAASTYLRGLSFAFAPTTLLAQVDASVGGKNGVNLQGYKNQVGMFNQPDFVLCDFAVLESLPQEELKNGFAEAIKSALVADERLFSFLEARASEALALDPYAIDRIVYDSLVIKSGIVSRDETEKGERRKLNFGHTIGHALEKACNLRHGEAVSVGMLVAARLSLRKGLLSEGDVARIERLLKAFDLPAKVQADLWSVQEALWKDKKREDDQIHVVLLDGIGRARVEPLGVYELDEEINDLCQSG
jgi:3-dehydroquinate synthase